jgi:hypothetical protein
MQERTQDRLYAAGGIASVVLVLGGVAVGATGGRKFATITSTPAEVAHALAEPVGPAAWVGAYMEILSYGFFLAFAVWAAAKLGSGLLPRIAVATGVAYATLSIAALATQDAIAYRAGHGISLDLGTALFTLGEAFYVGSWFMSAFFLLAAGGAALAIGRSVLGWSGIAVAAVTLVLTAVSLDNLGQMANLLWLLWVVAASIALARHPASRTSPISSPPLREALDRG